MKECMLAAAWGWGVTLSLGNGSTFLCNRGNGFRLCMNLLCEGKCPCRRLTTDSKIRGTCIFCLFTMMILTMYTEKLLEQVWGGLVLEVLVVSFTVGDLLAVIQPT